MKQYLVDTNICIYYLKGQFNLDKKFEEVNFDNCAISEITLAELRYGAERSVKKKDNHQVVTEFSSRLSIIPIYNAINVYAEEKARLKQEGKMIDDFDLLIGATAICNDMTLVSRNVKHFERMQNIQIQNWVKE